MSSPSPPRPLQQLEPLDQVLTAVTAKKIAMLSGVMATQHALAAITQPPKHTGASAMCRRHPRLAQDAAAVLEKKLYLHLRCGCCG